MNAGASPRLAFFCTVHVCVLFCTCSTRRRPQPTAPATQVPRDTRWLNVAMVKTADECTARRTKANAASPNSRENLFGYMTKAEPTAPMWPIWVHRLPRSVRCAQKRRRRRPRCFETSGTRDGNTDPPNGPNCMLLPRQRPFAHAQYSDGPSPPRRLCTFRRTRVA